MQTLPGEMELGQAVTSLTRMLGEFMHSKRQNQALLLPHLTSALLLRDHIIDLRKFELSIPFLFLLLVQIVHQLSRKQNLAARFARVEQRSRHVAVNKATACAECGALIGLKLCGLHPSGNLMCYQARGMRGWLV